jgi:pathogenesis-related protein 1
MIRLILLALLAVSCGKPTCQECEGPASDAGPEPNDWVGAHNRARSMAQPAPAPALPLMQWSDAIASKAASWAGRCNFVHDTSGSYGENLYAGTSAPSPAEITNDWAAEASDYDYGRNTCTSGKVCGHYTQLVWRDSTEVGCAVQRCENAGPFRRAPWYLAVCNYSPQGNIVGRKPY